MLIVADSGFHRRVLNLLLAIQINNPTLQRQYSGVSAVAGAQFCQDVFDMGFDRIFRDGELEGNAFIGIAIGHLLEHFYLPFAQGITAGRGDQFHGDVGGDAAAATMYLAHGIEQVLAQHALEQVASGTSLDGTQGAYITFIGGQDNDFGLREFLAYCDGGVDAIHVRHLDIHEGDIRAQGAVTCQRFIASSGLTHQAHIGLAVYDAGDTLAKQRVVIH